jgi:7-cyano-7-deazaguanine reductase
MDEIPLGRATDYVDRYDPNLLARLPRAPARAQMGIGAQPPFTGRDVWNGYEFSWLDPRGLPRVSGLGLSVDADSPSMVESKSMKLYLNGFAQTRFPSTQAVLDVLTVDLGAAFGAPVAVALPSLQAMAQLDAAPGECLDDLEVAIETYERDPGLLALEAGAANLVEQTLHSHLFRSLCPVTAQPDWATIAIRYRGPAIDRAALLRYLVSYRRHQAFHETTVEQIWMDLKAGCSCEELLVAGYFLRRGGLDINPVRTDAGRAKGGAADDWPVARLARQ